MLDPSSAAKPTDADTNNSNGRSLPNSPWINPKRRKQVARIVKHLRHQLDRQPTTLPGKIRLPSSWMVDCLIHNCPLPLLQPAPPGDAYPGGQFDWHGALIRALAYIAHHTEGSPRGKHPLTQLDGVTPLFPNQEHYQRRDAHLFSRALINHLEQQLT